jgi:hypothetical protein
MTLAQILRFNDAAAPDFLEVFVGLRPASNAHPPSLRNPTPVKIPMQQDGWHPGDAPQARAAAKARLFDALEKGRRQIGTPQVARTANWPVFPQVDKWI